MRKQAAIYDPYLDTLGGGERYCLTVAEILLKHGYKVDLFWSGNPKLVEQASQRFSLNLENLNIVPDIFGIKPQKIELIEDKQNLVNFINRSLNPSRLNFKLSNFINKIQQTKQYDLFFYLSDGSTPFLFSKKNILHIQVPFQNHPTIQRLFSDFFKLKLISKVICNSKFTSKFQQELYKDKVSVLYPPVDLDKFDSKKQKEKIILSVGRFDNILNAKKQDVLIDAFKSLVENERVSDWKLILAAGSIFISKVSPLCKVLIIFVVSFYYFITRNRLIFSSKFARLRTKFAVFRESIKTLLTSKSIWKKQAVLDFYLHKFEKGSWL